MQNAEQKAHELADKAIQDPQLLSVLDDARAVLFAVAVFKYDQDKAHKIMDLKYPTNKPDLWIDYIDRYNDSQLNTLENQPTEQ